jgi:hypothetical protein
MRLLRKDIIINRLSLIPTISRFENTFIILCLDDITTIKFFNYVSFVRHASFFRKFEFDFSDAYLCFFNNNTFLEQLRWFFLHISSTPIEGTNTLLAYSYRGIFLNMYNKMLINNLLLTYVSLVDFENFLFQAIICVILLIEVFFISVIDLFLLSFEKFLLIL